MEGEVACRGTWKKSSYSQQMMHQRVTTDLYTLDKIEVLLDIDKRELITGKD